MKTARFLPVIPAKKMSLIFLRSVVKKEDEEGRDMNENPIRKQKDAPGFMLYTVSRSLFEALEPVTVKRLLLAMMDRLPEITFNMSGPRT